MVTRYLPVKFLIDPLLADFLLYCADNQLTYKHDNQPNNGTFDLMDVNTPTLTTKNTDLLDM